MGLKFKNQNPISDNNTLKVYFCTQTISDDPNDPYTDDDIIIVYHIAATTLDEAVDIWIENYSEKILQEKITGKHGQIIIEKKLIMYI